MSVDHLDIYRNQAQEYEGLVAWEDYQGQIWQTFQTICDWEGKTVFDLGTGTGRLMKILMPEAGFICGFDASPAMLTVANQELFTLRRFHWSLVLADHRAIPAAEQSADRIVSGWSLAYLALNQGAGWRDKIQEIFEGYARMLRSGGKFIILETMGTGFERPNPPDDLLQYYQFLADWGFESTWIRTDYRFPSPEKAVQKVRFFFGDELAEAVQQSGSAIVPECTGVWWKSFGD